MNKKIKGLSWKPVQLDGSIFSTGAEGLIGIEVCQSYDSTEKASRVSLVACELTAKCNRSNCRKERGKRTRVRMEEETEVRLRWMMRRQSLRYVFLVIEDRGQAKIIMILHVF